MSERSLASGAEELPHLATFAMAAEQGGFTAAAVALGLSQAAVSQRMAVLEGRLQVALFRRQAGGVSLTEAGERLYPFAKQILELHQQARIVLGGSRAIVAGDLLLAASSVPGECFLPELLSGFHEQFPRVHVRATVGDSGSVMRDIEQGRAALGLVGQEIEKPSLEFRPFGADCLVLVVGTGHRWATRKRIRVKTLAGEPLIIRELGSGSRVILEKSLEQSGSALAFLDVTLELGSNAAIKDAVKRGLGVAFLSRRAVERELAADELREVAVDGLALDRRFYLVHHRHRPISQAASAFLHFVESHPIGRARP